MDHIAGLGVNLSWLHDPDDVPIMAAAIAAGIPGTLVTENKRDFPWGESRNAVLFLGSADFLAALHEAYPDALADVAEYRETELGDL